MLVSDPFTFRSWTRAQVDTVSRGWWVLLLSGVASVVAGGIIVLTDWSIEDLATFIGIFLVIRGVLMMFSMPIDGSIRNWSIGFGLVEAAFGVAVFVWPRPTLLVIAAVIGWYVLFSGIMAIAGSITGRGLIPYWGLVLAFGIFEVAISFWLLSQPGFTLLAAVLTIGFWSMVYGVVLIALSVEIKHLPERLRDLERTVDGAAPGHPPNVAAVG